MIVEPVNKGQVNNTHRGRSDITPHSRCRGTASSVHSKISFPSSLTSWISHTAPLKTAYDLCKPIRFSRIYRLYCPHFVCIVVVLIHFAKSKQNKTIYITNTNIWSAYEVKNHEILRQRLTCFCFFTLVWVILINIKLFMLCEKYILVCQMHH